MILDWSETVVSPEESSFSLDRIERLLPALVVGFIGEHTYARPDPGESGGHCVDLYDNGCGALVAEVLALVATIATTIHGEKGRRLVAAARADLARHLNRIADMIVGR